MVVFPMLSNLRRHNDKATTLMSSRVSPRRYAISYGSRTRGSDGRLVSRATIHVCTATNTITDNAANRTRNSGPRRVNMRSADIAADGGQVRDEGQHVRKQ